MKTISAGTVATFGSPGFFTPRMPPPYFAPPGTPGAAKLMPLSILRMEKPVISTHTVPSGPASVTSKVAVCPPARFSAPLRTQLTILDGSGPNTLTDWYDTGTHR